MSAKKAEVRIPVTDVDRLMELTDAQLRVWLYYKRREGADGKAYGKSTTIAAWSGYTSPTSFQSIKNARSWLTRKGWLKPNGKSQSGLPQFLAVIPRLPLEASEGNPTITPTVIPELPQPSSYDYTEVPTLKKQPEKDSALRYATSGKNLVSEGVSEGLTFASLTSSASRTSTESKPVQAFEQDKPKSKPDQDEFPTEELLPAVPDVTSVVDVDGYESTLQEFHMFEMPAEAEAFYDPPFAYSKVLGRNIDHSEWDVAYQLYVDFVPEPDPSNPAPNDADLVALVELCLKYGTQLVRDMWAYNKRHKNGKYLFHGIGAKFQNAFASDSDDNLYFQMRDHDIRKCPTCRSLPKCAQ